MSLEYIEPVFLKVGHFKDVCQRGQNKQLHERFSFVHSFIQQTQTELSPGQGWNEGVTGVCNGFFFFFAGEGSKWSQNSSSFLYRLSLKKTNKQTNRTTFKLWSLYSITSIAGSNFEACLSRHLHSPPLLPEDPC